MDKDENSYIKSDDNKLINEQCIRWIKKANDCYVICDNLNGCKEKQKDIHKVCKLENPDNYNKLNQWFR